MFKIIDSGRMHEGNSRHTLSKGLYIDEYGNIYLGGIEGPTTRFSDGNLKSVASSEFRYDGLGNLVTISNTLDGHLEFHYYSSRFPRLEGKVSSILGESLCGGDGLAFQYDDSGRLKSLDGVMRGDRVMYFIYGSNGKISKITNTDRGTVVY